MKLLHRLQKQGASIPEPSPQKEQKPTPMPITTALSPALKKQKKQQLFRTSNACKELLREPFPRAQEMQVLYRNGEAFHLLQGEIALLGLFPALLPTLTPHQLTRIENLELSTELLQEKKEAIDLLLPPFLEKETRLKSDINAFTKAVSEAQTKYKLSPDWNGKKASMMALGTQLEERREIYNKEEAALTLKLENLYALHLAFYQEFSLFCEEMIPLLESAFQALS